MNKISQISKTLTLVIILFSQVFYSNNAQAYPVPPASDVIKQSGFPSQESLPRRMNILVWNLHKGEDPAFATDFIELAYKKDIIIGQEMLLNSAMISVFRSFPQYSFTSATSFFLGKKPTRTGVTTAGPVSPAEVGYVRTQTLEPIVNSPKVTLISRFPIKASNKLLTVVNIHGINFVDGASYQREINRIYETIKHYPSPIIFAGDFNSWSDERDTILKNLCRKLNLRPANFFPDHRMTFNNHPLDHFFYSDDIRVIEAKVENFYLGSDHKPLELIVEYSPTEELKRIAQKN